jgi:hypothetical protein
MAMKHAQKLMTIYARQLETLNKHRGEGQQKVTVEHVIVTAGGRAERAPAGLEHRAETPMEEIPPAEKAPRGKTRR